MFLGSLVPRYQATNHKKELPTTHLVALLSYQLPTWLAFGSTSWYQLPGLALVALYALALPFGAVRYDVSYVQRPQPRVKLTIPPE